MSRVILRTTILTSVLVCRAADPEDASLRNEWLQAPISQGAKWNRTALLERIVTGVDMVRTPARGVLEMFGPPGYSAAIYPGDSRMDFYRLSAANDESLRFDYESGNVVTRYSVEASGCSCQSCNARAALYRGSFERKRITSLTAPREKTLTMTEFEKLVGRAGDRTRFRQNAGGQVWLNYTETWRVSPPPFRFLVLDGHVPLRSAPTEDVGDKPVLSWALISFAPGCLAK